MTQTSLQFVSGTLFYRERIALPPNARVSVELAFQPAGSETPEVIGLETYETEGRQVPLPFSVPYNAAEIDGRRNYFLRARIEHDGGRFRFANQERVHVITRGNPTSDVMVMLRQAPVETRTAAVSGHVLMRERAALRPNSLLIVRLQDVSRADAPAHVLGEQIYTTEGEQPPLPFTVTYDPDEIDERFSYSIGVRIEDQDGILRFISDTHNPVVTRGYPTTDVEVWVRSV